MLKDQLFKTSGLLFDNWKFSGLSRNRPQTPGRPVSQKSRNFSGLFRVPQFPLHLRNTEVLSHQTSHPLGFSCINTMFKDQLFKRRRLQFDDSIFGLEKFSGLSRNGRWPGSLRPLKERPWERDCGKLRNICMVAHQRHRKKCVRMVKFFKVRVFIFIFFQNLICYFEFFYEKIYKTKNT